MQNGRVNQ